MNLEAEPSLVLADTFMIALWETQKQRTLLSHAWIVDSQKLCGQKYLLF